MNLPIVTEVAIQISWVTIKIAINYATCIIVVVHWYDSNTGHEIEDLLSKHRLTSPRGASNSHKYYPFIVLHQELDGADHDKEAFLKRQWLWKGDDLIAACVLPFHQLDLVTQKAIPLPWRLGLRITTLHSKEVLTYNEEP